MNSSALSLLWMFAIIILVLVLAYVSTRLLANRGGVMQPGRHIQILEQQL